MVRIAEGKRESIFNVKKYITVNAIFQCSFTKLVFAIDLTLYKGRKSLLQRLKSFFLNYEKGSNDKRYCAEIEYVGIDGFESVE